MIQQQEKFLPIPDLPGYFISNQGRVRRGNTKILKPVQLKYRQVISITCDGKRRVFTVSKLVKEAFGDWE